MSEMGKIEMKLTPLASGRHRHELGPAGDRRRRLRHAGADAAAARHDPGGGGAVVVMRVSVHPILICPLDFIVGWRSVPKCYEEGKTEMKMTPIACTVFGIDGSGGTGGELTEAFGCFSESGVAMNDNYWRETA